MEDSSQPHRFPCETDSVHGRRLGSHPLLPLVDPMYQPPRDRLLRVTQIAARLNLKPRTVRQKITEGKLPGFRNGPKLLMCWESDLENYVREQENRAD